MGQQEAAQDRTQGYPETRRSRPDPHGPDTVLLLSEHVGQNRKSAGHQVSRSHSHYRPGQHQAIRANRFGRERRPTGKDHESGEEDPLSPDPVTESAYREQQTGEDHRIGVHDPLQLAGAGTKTPYDRREGHVEDCGVQADQEQRHAEHSQGCPPVARHLRRRHHEVPTSKITASFSSQLTVLLGRNPALRYKEPSSAQCRIGRGARVVRRGCKAVFCTLARLTYRQLWVSSSCSLAPVVPNSARAATSRTREGPWPGPPRETER